MSRKKVTKIEFNGIKYLLEKGLSRSEVMKASGRSEMTINRVDGSENYEEYMESGRQHIKKTQDKQTITGDKIEDVVVVSIDDMYTSMSLLHAKVDAISAKLDLVMDKLGEKKIIW